MEGFWEVEAMGATGPGPFICPPMGMFMPPMPGPLPPAFMGGGRASPLGLCRKGLPEGGPFGPAEEGPAVGGRCGR